MSVSAEPIKQSAVDDAVRQHQRNAPEAFARRADGASAPRAEALARRAETRSATDAEATAAPVPDADSARGAEAPAAPGAEADSAADAKAAPAPDAGLRCTLCGLSACWTG